MKIFLNPGHAPGGYPDPGAYNRTYCLKEAVLVKEIGELVEQYLRKTGCETYLLQSDNLRNNPLDDDLSQPCIVTEANDWLADLAISIHLNAFNSQVHGTECVCYKRKTAADVLAQCIQKRLVKALGTVDRGVKYEEDKEKDFRLSFCMQTYMPAVIVEPGFLDNDDEAKLIVKNIDTIAKAIACGVTDFLEEE